MNSIQSAEYRTFLEKFQKFAQDPFINEKINEKTCGDSKNEKIDENLRMKNLLENNAKTIVKKHWEFMEENVQIISLDILRQEEKLQQSLALRAIQKSKDKKFSFHENEEQNNEISEILKKAQNELAELSMQQALEISQTTEESVFSMLKEEDQLENFYKAEILKIEKQLGENSPTKVKIVQKLNEKKELAKSAAMKKIEEIKEKKLQEINEKYDILRSEKMKLSDEILKKKLFSNNNLPLRRTTILSPKIKNMKKRGLTIEISSESPKNNSEEINEPKIKNLDKNQANVQEPLLT